MAIGPVEQIYAQAGAGSAGGQGFGDFAVQGYQLGLAGRRLQLEEEREQRLEKRDNALLDLQRRAIQLRNTETGLQIQKMETDARYELGLKEADLMVSQLSSSLAQSGSWGSPESWQAWANITNAMPLAAVSKSGQLFLQQQRLAIGNQQLAQQFGKPTEVEVKNELGGTTTYGGKAASIEPEIREVDGVKFYRTGAGSWARVPTQLDAPTGVTVTDPVSGNPIPYVRTGPNSFSRIPMSSGQQQLEQAEVGSGDIFEKGRQLLPLINDRTTGIRGGVQRLARDTGVGLLFPNAIDPQVSEADAVSREFAAKLVRGLRSDGNINEREFRSLESEANTLKWVDERTGKTRLVTFVEGAVKKARDASQRLGRPINEKYLTFDELAKRAEAKAESGEMTREQAMDWALKAYANSAERFIQDVRASIK